MRGHVNPNNNDFDTNHLVTLIFKENRWNLKKDFTAVDEANRKVIDYVLNKKGGQ